MTLANDPGRDGALERLTSWLASRGLDVERFAIHGTREGPSMRCLKIPEFEVFERDA